MNKKTIYLIVTRDSSYYLRFLPGFVKAEEYDTAEKECFPKDVGKIDLEYHVFRFCFYEGTVVKKERFFLAKPDSQDLVECSLDEMLDSMSRLIHKEEI